MYPGFLQLEAHLRSVLFDTTKRRAISVTSLGAAFTITAPRGASSVTSQKALPPSRLQEPHIPTHPRGPDLLCRACGMHIPQQPLGTTIKPRAIAARGSGISLLAAPSGVRLSGAHSRHQRYAAMTCAGMRLRIPRMWLFSLFFNVCS